MNPLPPENARKRLEVFHLWSFAGLRWEELLKRAWKRFWTCRLPDHAARLAFYFLLSAFPMLLFVLTLLGFVLSSGPAFSSALHQHLSAVAPRSASGLIETTLAEIADSPGGGRLSLALMFTLWTTSRGVRAVMDGLNAARGSLEPRSWKERNLRALALTVVYLILSAAVLFLVVTGGRLGRNLTAEFGSRDLLAYAGQIMNWLVTVAVALVALNILYIYGPSGSSRRWFWLTPGSVAGVSIWLLASFGFKLYLRYYNQFSLTYGSIGAVIILLLWFYLTGIAVLAGEALNFTIESALASRTERRSASST